jgi:hypothetical protein
VVMGRLASTHVAHAPHTEKTAGPAATPVAAVTASGTEG